MIQYGNIIIFPSHIIHFSMLGIYSELLSLDSPFKYIPSMPKQLSHYNKTSKSNFISNSSTTSNVRRRITQASRQLNEAAHRLPVARRPFDSKKSYQHYLGPCDVVCSMCQALHWIQKRSYKSTIDDPLFFNCCQRGQIILPLFPDSFEPLISLLRNQMKSIYPSIICIV